MLSGESAIGSYGQKALSVLRTASNRMELWSREENQQSTLYQPPIGVSLPERIAEQICNCAAEIGELLNFPKNYLKTINAKVAFGMLILLAFGQNLASG